MYTYGWFMLMYAGSHHNIIIIPQNKSKINFFLKRIVSKSILKDKEETKPIYEKLRNFISTLFQGPRYMKRNKNLVFKDF